MTKYLYIFNGCTVDTSGVRAREKSDCNVLGLLGDADHQK
jgi:hypothetical protein